MTNEDRQSLNIQFAPEATTSIKTLARLSPIAFISWVRASEHQSLKPLQGYALWLLNNIGKKGEGTIIVARHEISRSLKIHGCNDVEITRAITYLTDRNLVRRLWLAPQQKYKLFGSSTRGFVAVALTNKGKKCLELIRNETELFLEKVCDIASPPE